jgi:hypothetical protein
MQVLWRRRLIGVFQLWRRVTTAGAKPALLVEQRDVFGWSSFRPRLQVRVNVREFLVRDDFRGEGWHLASRLPDVLDEGANETLWRPDARARRLSRALPLAPVAFVTAIFRKNLLSVFRIPRRSRFALLALRRRVLRSRRRGRHQKDRANHRQSDTADHPRAVTTDFVQEWNEHAHELLFGDIVPQERPR